MMRMPYRFDTSRRSSTGHDTPVGLVANQAARPLGEQHGSPRKIDQVERGTSSGLHRVTP